MKALQIQTDVPLGTVLKELSSRLYHHGLEPGDGFQLTPSTHLTRKAEAPLTLPLSLQPEPHELICAVPEHGLFQV